VDTLLALTMGEPAGIGGELTLKAWLALRTGGPRFLVLDDPQRLLGLARDLGLDVPVRSVANADEARTLFASALPVLPLDGQVHALMGQADPANAGAVTASIARAGAMARDGIVDGVVTNPIHKATLYRAGFPHPGHTEFLAALAGGGARPIMLLAGAGLRVVPATIHCALREVPSRLTTELIVDTTVRTAEALRGDFGIAAPRLVVAGLNPHAGEEGALGDEEQRVIGPAVAHLQSLGLDVRGPLPPDTMFAAHARGSYDAAICMYHDQALIPLKTLDMDGGVNVTLGLPFVRTSPDHGTALDIAGQGIASPGSVIAALRLAATIAANRGNNAA
jgi:4-hydroxythreonine-4-phosphate dehydrogenase